MVLCKFVVGNWKMNGMLVLLVEIDQICVIFVECDVLICLFVMLIQVVVVIGIVIGGQDCYVNVLGVYIGDIVVVQLCDVGVSYVIFGYFECCIDYVEIDLQVVVKVIVVYQVGLVVVICVGEIEIQCDSGVMFDVILVQFVVLVFDCIIVVNIVIVYEFVWVIGIGCIFIDVQIVEVYVLMCDRLFVCFVDGVDIILFYGGLVKLGNVVEIFVILYVNGVLVGGVSLKVVDFGLIIIVFFVV